MKPAYKNIVLCSDGTGNKDIKARGTNVFKLYEAIDIQGHKNRQSLTPQIAFYDDGVGTESFLPWKILGGAFGWGFSRNIRSLYTVLVHAYKPGDRIFLFGFSRGAYTVRALAGMIQYCGILDAEKFPTNSGLEQGVKNCWQEFKESAFDNRKRGDSDSDIDRRTRLNAVQPEKVVDIEFVGVWDTVGAVGLPFDELTGLLNWFFPRRFVDFTPTSSVKRACHAVSIDDERRTFHPVLWDEQGAPHGLVDQVWFAGVHSNVGGGYSKQGMSLVTLDWMMAEAEERGLYFIPDAREYVRMHQDVHDKLYDSRAGLADYYRWSPRDITRLCSARNIPKPKIHVSVFERIAHGTNGYTPGNIPVRCEVVTTRGSQTWPSSTALHGVAKEIKKMNPGRTPLDDMYNIVESGRWSYYAFLVATIGLLLWLFFRPDHLWIVMGVGVVAAAVIWLWAAFVDSHLGSHYSSCWYKHREALRKILFSPNVAGRE